MFSSSPLSVAAALVGPGVRRVLVSTVLALLFGSAQAQPGQSMEERLRAQLRITTTQLQQAQNELAALKSAPGAAKSAAPPADVEGLKKDLAHAQAQLASQRKASGEQNQVALEKVNAQLAQQRAAYEGALKLARAAESERSRLHGENEARHAALTQCEVKNAHLYAVSQEILHAYETIDMGSLIAARQPFAAQSRVKLEQAAQTYGDQLYAERFDARSVPAPAQSAAATAKAVDGSAAVAKP